jgi:hypothetical protein
LRTRQTFVISECFHMRKEDLEKLYRGWDKEKLLDAFKKRHEYTEDALAAMLLVMKEKGLSGIAEMELQIEKEKTQENAAASKASVNAHQKKYEAQMLKDDSGAKEYAEKSRINGEYMKGRVANSRYRGLRTLLFSLSLVGFMMLVLTFFLGSLFDYSALVFGGATALFGLGGYFMYRNSKASYRFQHEGNRDVLEVEHGNYAFRAVVPFSYFVYWSMMEYQAKGIKVSHPVLGLGVTNKENETIVLLGNLTALQDAPPAWPEVWNVKIPKDTKFFNEVAGHQVNIIKLKKILDGLHEK